MALPFDKYRFVLCSDQGEPFGDIGKAYARKATWQRNGAHTAEVTLDIEDALALRVAPGLTRLKVFCSSVTTRPVFYGILPATNAPWSASSGTYALTFIDPRGLFFPNRFNAGTENYAQVDQGAILQGLLDLQNARSGGETFIRAGINATGTLRDRTYSDVQDLATLFSQMSEVIGGPDFDVTPFDGFASPLTYGSTRIMGLLNVYSRQGNLLPNAKFIYGPKLASNCADISGTNQPIVTLDTVTGAAATDGSAPLTSTYGDPASSPYGMMEARENAQDVIIQATLDAQSRGTVEQARILRPVLTIKSPTREAPQPFREYYLGDTVYATCRKGAIQYADLALRVDAFSVTDSQEGELAVDITTSTNA